MAKKTITITLYMSELIYDIQNKTYITGRSRQTGNNFEEVANMQANDDDENANQIVRSIQNAYGLAKSKLSEFIEESETTGSNELISSEDNITVTLKMPGNYNESTVESISSAVHRFIVNTAVGEWFSMTNKADAADYFNLATGCITDIREAINKRVRPTRTEVGG